MRAARAATAGGAVGDATSGMAGGATSGAGRRERLDSLMVRRGLAANERVARALLLAGRVHGRGRRLIQAGMLIAADAEIEVTAGARFVSRGGEKLAAALAAWPLDVTGRVCLDVGASTGGFTDCLLQRGAAEVRAVDVGYGQLATALRNDSRVTSMERTNAREMPLLEPRPALVTIDVSFIGLAAVLPRVAEVASAGADVVALVKPQFEAARDDVDDDGVVRDRMAQARAVTGLLTWGLKRGWRVGGVLRSPLRGPKGNREWFVWLRTPGSPA